MMRNGTVLPYIVDLESECEACRSQEGSLSTKAAFLKARQAYGSAARPVTSRETPMSWPILTTDQVYTLKKAVRFSYPDYSPLQCRRDACNAELSLGRRFAPEVYKALPLLTCQNGTLRVTGPGRIADWLVVMRRLDGDGTLERMLPRANTTKAAVSTDRRSPRSVAALTRTTGETHRLPAIGIPAMTYGAFEQAACARRVNGARQFFPAATRREHSEPAQANGIVALDISDTVANPIAAWHEGN